MIQFLEQPKLVGNFPNARPSYNIDTDLTEVGLLGEHLNSIDYYGSVSDMLDHMQVRMDTFNQDQQLKSYDPLEWINIGYWLDPLSTLIIAYYQIRYPNYEPPDQTYLTF